jgi:PiT family inorganic phosphate transporter
MMLILAVIVVALVFEYINGFHDTANSIATVVSTKVLTPRQAVILAAVTNLLGACWGTAVAKTITGGIIATTFTLGSQVLMCVLIGAITWNLITWWFGLPSSSSHALIGGLCGGALAASHNDWHVIQWSVPSAAHWYKWGGLLWKVLVPMILSPLAGFILGFVIMVLLYLLLHDKRPARVNAFFGRAQMVSAGAMGFMHGTNDAQKTMGIIALVLMGGTQTGALSNLPSWLHFLYTPPPAPKHDLDIALWIKVLCAITMASGTAVGGWRIIKTLGHRMVKLHPINGFAAEASSATVIAVASVFGIPVSTTHNISASIMGVGCARRFSAIKWTVVERMVWAWIFTIPVSGAISYCLVRLIQAAGVVP